MGALSNYAENLILNWLFTTGTATRPTAWYISLHTADPTEDGTVAEVSGGSYARTAVTFSTASGGALSNSGDITFPTATGSWGTVTHTGLWDAATGGNFLTGSGGALTASKVVASGDIFKFLATTFSPSMD